MSTLKKIITISALTLLLAGCAAPNQAPTASEKLAKFCNSNPGVKVVEDLAATTTDAVVPFPKVDVLKADLEALDQFDYPNPGEYKVLEVYSKVFSNCLTSPAVLLLENSWKQSLAEDFN